MITQYSAIVSDGIQVIAQSLQETYVSQSLAATSREEVNLYESEMLVLQENDVYTAAVLAGRLSAAAQMSFGQLVSVRRYLVQEAVPQLDPEASGLYQRYVPSRLSLALAHLEDQVTQAPAGAKPPVPLATWQATVKAYATNLEVMLTQGPNWIQSQVTASARSALVTLIAAAILGLLAVIASVVFSAVMGRRLLRRLADLRESALTLAHDQLPSLMARLRRGERVDVDAEAPPAKSSVDELDQVQEAFTVVHRAAVAAAVDESNLRRGVNDVFRNLARRSQLLLQRQLALLDGMERRAEEPDQLADLFRIDHLTTRMRRHAEGLIILSGESTGRNWREPVPLFDVVRAAVAEVEDYTRVNIEIRVKTALVGRAVADVIHLLAELIENATAFSPPDARVTIAGTSGRPWFRRRSAGPGARHTRRAAEGDQPGPGQPPGLRSFQKRPARPVHRGAARRQARHHGHAQAVGLRRGHCRGGHSRTAGGDRGRGAGRNRRRRRPAATVGLQDRALPRHRRRVRRAGARAARSPAELVDAPEGDRQACGRRRAGAQRGRRGAVG